MLLLAGMHNGMRNGMENRVGNEIGNRIENGMEKIGGMGNNMEYEMEGMKNGIGGAGMAIGCRFYSMKRRFVCFVCLQQ